MKKLYNQIFINGDSYSAERSDHLVYSDFLRQELGIQIINQASRGSNNSRIIRDSVESLLSIKEQYPNDKILSIIGLSFVGRDEVWYEGTDANILKHIPDLIRYPDSKLITADFLLNQSSWDSVKDIIVDLNINRQLTHFYTNLFMFTNTLENFNIDYLIFSAANNSDWRNAQWNYIKSLNMYKQCESNPNIINLHKFNIPQFAHDQNLTTRSTGHMFEDGHKEFSKFLLDKINAL